MKLVLVGAEAAPFVKTGGLGDVLGALADALAQRGHEVHLYVPGYKSVLDRISLENRTVKTIHPPSRNGRLETEVIRLPAEPGKPLVSFIRCPAYFDRAGYYVDGDGRDWPDNSDRFAYFCRAVLESVAADGLNPDVFHAHDWQTGLLPAYLAAEPNRFPYAASVFTIHNLSFQGNFDFADWPGVLLDGSFARVEAIEFYGRFSHMKAGLVFADQLTAVSPTYAREITTPEFGAGMDGVVRSRKDNLTGVLNGIATDRWSPESDVNLPVQYDGRSWKKGKAAAKSQLFESLPLEDVHRPLIGSVGRLTMQKGFDLFAAVAEPLIHRGANLIVLTTPGSYELELPLWNLAQRFPTRAAVYFGFNEGLSRLIYAASDLIAVPSRFEPCGLTQLLAMKYGAVPVVRAVGGLADTIRDADPKSIATGVANGFVFQHATPGALNVSLQRALYAFEKPELWDRLVQTGMAGDYSWGRIVPVYEDVYARATSQRG